MVTRNNYSLENMWVFAGFTWNNNSNWQSGSSIYGPGSLFMDIVNGIATDGMDTPDWINSGITADFESEFRLRYVLIPNP
jgi:hypothetical protein